MKVNEKSESFLLLSFDDLFIDLRGPKGERGYPGLPGISGQIGPQGPQGNKMIQTHG